MHVSHLRTCTQTCGNVQWTPHLSPENSQCSLALGPHMLLPFCACHTYAPSMGGLTRVTRKRLIPLDIRPSHPFALVCMCHTHAPAPTQAMGGSTYLNPA
ncbi:hypothetical protein O181_091015 [Austropuccinia psidii MF-1]|uniref:Uncharacterized protein n=1 Tax=Austropuccinia psidii MF-1 TaxID=1389203 RepID=A0A9Q3P7N6_9BASI|nr:hypothetical protein [Austropuccinia psidii MF-1]